ncbi:CBS domain-containing protein [Methanoplanus sp. FWC-SCC4]|uniref:CBS domain-containing protein n=1 Tax=Methanochimaera problematica TaxID=2609417 RepID=A0AA97FCH1_9EURY|nr:CBS domain-containing protein [Methanoplanus sp. FWC-SCC4]WOF16522.1 CBS domain-containing protein [Methanoplanus sp. FWC-SCC4]
MAEKLLVKDVMSKPVTIAKSSPITEALDKMLDEGLDPLVVTNNGGVVGTISRKSIADILGSKKTSAVSPTKIHVANQMDENFTSVYPDQEAEVLVPLLQEYKVVAVFDDEHNLVGKVDANDLLASVYPDSSVENLMQVPHTINSGERVVHLRRRMIDEGVMKFVVTGEDGIEGVVTETDIASSMREFRESGEGKRQEYRVRNLLVSDIMTSPAMTVNSEMELKSVIDLIVNKKISSLPVVKDGKLAGIIFKDALVMAL